MRALLPLLLSAVLLGGPAMAERDGGLGAFYDSSMLAWVDAFARSLLPRLDGAKSLELEVTAEAGLDERRAARLMRTRLRERLAQDGVAVKAGAGQRLEVALSITDATVWAVGRLEGDREGAVVASWPVDRELEALLVTPRARLGQGRWALDRLGTVPAGVLDLVLMDLDGRDGDELALLTVDGVRTLRFEDGGARPTPLSPLWPLPVVHPSTHPAGWVAGVSRGIAATSTAHGALRFGLDGAEVPSEGVQLRQPPDPAHPNSLRARSLGGADLQVESAEGLAALSGIPERVRDVQLWPGHDAAVWVQHDGQLGGRRPDGEVFVGPVARVGDRIVLGDLDADGRVDLASTEASAPDEGDRLSVHRLDETSAPLLFQAAFDGSVVALAAGDLDFDGQPDLVLAEEVGGERALLWRLERR